MGEGAADGEPADAGPDGTGPLAARSLAVWAFGSSHAALLVAVAVLALYLTGSAGQVLAGLATWVGVVAYGYLWAVAWWAARRTVAGAGPELLDGTVAPADLLVAAIRWGGAAGFLVFLPVLALGIVRFVAAGGVEAVPIVVLGAAVGSALSVGVGAIVGGGFALFDLLLLRVARAWLPANAAPGSPGPPDSGSAGP